MTVLSFKVQMGRCGGCRQGTACVSWKGLPGRRE